MQTLHPNTLLQGGRYKIIKTLGKGGFGITYLALQSGLERQVAVKEFFMKDCCERNESTSHVTLGTSGAREQVGRFREKFLKEARNIAKLNHPNIVRIIDVFEENGTAYYVMEYAEGGSLADKVTAEGHLSESVAIRYIAQVAEALDYIHQRKMNHLDVKPGNIMLTENDDAVLIDFGLAKQYDAATGGQTSTTPVGISEGYAPMEQYKQGGVGEFTPETDIYALGATFFKLLTGVTPPSASDVMEDGVPVDKLRAYGVSQTVIDVISKAMESRKKNRQNDVVTFMKELNAGYKGQATLKKPEKKTDCISAFGWNELYQKYEVLFNGNLYRLSEANIKAIDNLNFCDLECIQNVNAEDYISRVDYLSDILLLLPEDSNVYLNALRLTKNTNVKRILFEMAIVAFGVAFDKGGEGIYSILYKGLKQSVEFVCGVDAILGSSCEVNDYVDSADALMDTIELSDLSYFRALVKGCVTQLKIINKDSDVGDLVLLDVIPINVDIVIKENQKVRDYLRFVEQDTTVPYRHSEIISLNDTVLYG